MPLPYRKLTALMTRYNGSSLLIDLDRELPARDGKQQSQHSADSGKAQDRDQYLTQLFHFTSTPRLLLISGHQEKLIPMNPEKAMAMRPAATRAIGIPLNAFGGLDILILSLTPAKMTMASVKPTADENP